MIEVVEKRPRGAGWKEVPPPVPPMPGTRHHSWWVNGPLVVGSALVDAELPGGDGAVGPQWQVSVSCDRRRPGRTELRRTLKAFGMAHAEEDNHHPGIARHYWLPVDPARRGLCECKVTETTIVEPDGYRWTNPTDGACRGCELTALTGKPCTLHRAALTTGGAE